MVVAGKDSRKKNQIEKTESRKGKKQKKEKGTEKGTDWLTTKTSGHGLKKPADKVLNKKTDKNGCSTQ